MKRYLKPRTKDYLRPKLIRLILALNSNDFGIIGTEKAKFKIFTDSLELQKIIERAERKKEM